MYDEGAVIDELARNNRLAADASPERNSFEWKAPWLHETGQVWVPDAWTDYEDYQTDEIVRGRTFKLVELDSDAARAANWLVSSWISDDELYRYLDYKSGWQTIPDDLYFDVGDLPSNYAILREERQKQSMLLDGIRLTQIMYHPWIVRQYYRTRGMRDNDGNLPYAIQFRDTDVLLLNGTHRFMSRWQHHKKWLLYDIDDITACRQQISARGLPVEHISDDRLRNIILSQQKRYATIQVEIGVIPMTVREAVGHLASLPKEDLFAEILEDAFLTLTSTSDEELEMEPV